MKITFKIWKEVIIPKDIIGLKVKLGKSTIGKIISVKKRQAIVKIYKKYETSLTKLLIKGFPITMGGLK